MAKQTKKRKKQDIKPHKKTQIEFIITRLRLGEKRGAILTKAAEKWSMSKSTFDRLLKIAKEQYAVEQEALKKKMEEQNAQNAIEEQRLNIMDSRERKEYLTQLIKGEVLIKKPFLIKGKIMEYPAEADHGERIRAMAELNKMGGDYAPQRKDITIQKGGLDKKEETEEYED